MYAIQIYIYFAGLGREHHAHMASFVCNQSKRPLTSDSQGETFQKSHPDRHLNSILNKMIAFVDAKLEKFLE